MHRLMGDLKLQADGTTTRTFPSAVLLLSISAATLGNFSGAGLGLLHLLFVIVSLKKTDIYELSAC